MNGRIQMYWSIKKEIAKGLLGYRGGISAVRKSRFTWASGIKSPIYCDNQTDPYSTGGQQHGGAGYSRYRKGRNTRKPKC